MTFVRWVECPCGCRTRVEIDQYGDRWDCPVCGLEQVLNEETTAPVSPESSPQSNPSARPAPQPAVPSTAVAEGAGDVALFEDDGEDIEPAAPVHAPIHAAVASEAACSRCGRPFRGDWDRIEADGEAYCNICANLATRPIAAPRNSPGDVPEDEVTREIDRMNEERWGQIAPPDRPELTEADRRLRRRQIKIYAAFSALILLAILLWPSDDGQFGKAVDPTELPLAVNWVIAVTVLLAGASATVAALYITLDVGNALPNENFAANLLAVSVVGLPFWLALRLLQIALSVISTFPLVGPLLATIVYIVVIVGVTQGIYELRLRYIPLLVVTLWMAAQVEHALRIMMLQAAGGIVG